MKKLTLVFTALILFACTGNFQTIDAIISPDAKEKFIKSGGTTIRIIESGAVNVATVPVVPELDANGNPTGVIRYTIGTCVVKWNLIGVTGYDPFWLGQGLGAPTAWEFVYDASEDQCPWNSNATQLRHAGGAYSATMNGTVAEVSIGIWTQ